MSDHEDQVEGEAMDTAAAGDEDDRKLFVGGLPQDAKEADLREHFSSFGEIEGVNVKTDPHTGRSRGFAFVVFKVRFLVSRRNYNHFRKQNL
jgi:RNA recognition motif-containing protein